MRQGSQTRTATRTIFEADYAFGFTTEALFECDAPATRIHSIQGPGATSGMAGVKVVIEGLVVGDFQGTTREGQPDPQMSGFFVQEEDADRDASDATSEGIFIFQPTSTASFVDVAAGDRVRVEGTVTEFNSSGIALTELTNVTNLLVCSSGHALTRVPVLWPVPSLDAWERYEGMAVKISQVMTVTETFNLGSFGEIVLATSRLTTPTNVVEPGAPRTRCRTSMTAARIILDDGSSLSRDNFDPPARLYPQDNAGTPLAADPGLSAATHCVSATPSIPRPGRLRACSTTGLAPTESIRPAPSASSMRTSVQPALLESAARCVSQSFNVLNYFTTLDTGAPACGPTGGLDCRGANTASEFTRQRAKSLPPSPHSTRTSWASSSSRTMRRRPFRIWSTASTRYPGEISTRSSIPAP